MSKSKFFPNVMLAVLATASLIATAAIIAVVLVRGVPQRSLAQTDGGDLPVLYDLPAFELTNQNEEPFGSADLKGKVYVTDFMFTRCNGICPMLSKNMQAVQEALKNEPGWEDVRLVSISVDAGHDTPAVLREYARRYGAEPGHWTFLTGPREKVWPLASEGFKLVVGEAPGNEVMPFNHSPKFVLVDRQGRVRAYHNGTSAEGREALIEDVRRLLKEQAS